MKKKRNLICLIATLSVIASVAIPVVITTTSDKPKSKHMSYVEYEQHLAAGEVDTVFYRDDDETMQVALFDDYTRTLSEEERAGAEYNPAYLYEVTYPAHEDFKLELLRQGVIVREGDVTMGAVMEKYGDLVFYLLLIGFMVLMFTKMSPMSKTDFARKAKANDIEISFDDVIGHEEIKEDLQLLVKQLKSGAKVKDISHGVLFEGGAGTGKTMLAKAIAHEAGVNFISVNSSNLVELYVGLGARRVRDAFKKARAEAPCVLFFDEIDAVGAQRGSQRSHRENDQTINALLTELDGFDEKGDILVIAATNRADNLDNALLRAGRFDRKIKIEAPKRWETRQELFDHYINGRNDDTVNTAELAKQTVGFSGADIAAVCREARLIAFREDSEQITQDFLEEAIDKIVFKGNRSNDAQHAKDLECVAYHEAGHAVMTLLCNRTVSRISILGMTSGIGGVVFQSDSERYYYTKQEIKEQVMIAYAGRASEEIRFGKDNITQGAANDITQATQLLTDYVTKFGFDDKTGLLDVNVIINNGILNTDILSRVSDLSNIIYKDTTDKLTPVYSLVERLAKLLLDKKTLSGDEVCEFAKSNGIILQKKDEVNHSDENS